MEISKKDRLINSFRVGKRHTAKQIAHRFDFASVNSAYATLTKLREEGWPVTAAPAKNGNLAYGF